MEYQKFVNRQKSYIKIGMQVSNKRNNSFAD